MLPLGVRPHHRHTTSLQSTSEVLWRKRWLGQGIRNQTCVSWASSHDGW
jgi:hypothetical protein